MDINCTLRIPASRHLGLRLLYALPYYIWGPIKIILFSLFGALLTILNGILSVWMFVSFYIADSLPKPGDPGVEVIHEEEDDR